MRPISPRAFCTSHVLEIKQKKLITSEEMKNKQHRNKVKKKKLQTKTRSKTQYIRPFYFVSIFIYLAYGEQKKIFLLKEGM